MDDHDADGINHVFIGLAYEGYFPVQKERNRKYDFLHAVYPVFVYCDAAWA